jgi:hypothetical protein
MDGAYTDKPEGKIPEDCWERKMADWRREEQQVKMAIQGINNAHAGRGRWMLKRIFELANNVFAESGRKGQIAQNAIFELLCRCRVTPTYRKPFDMIFERARLGKWSGRLDSN